MASAGRAATILQCTYAHDGPANHAQQPVDRSGRAALALAPFTLKGFRMLPPFRDAPIQEDSNSLVLCERSLEKVVEMLAIACNDDELSDAFRLVVKTPRPHSPHELVERALASAIASEPDAPQDFDGRWGRILAQPLRDLRRVLRQLRRAPDIMRFGALHGRTGTQI